MRTLKTDINYGTKSVEGQKQLSNIELTANYIQFAVDSKYKDGLNGQIRRMYGRIQRKLDEAIEKETKKIELEDGEFEFLQDAVRDSKFPTGLAKFVAVLEDELNKQNNSEEPSKK